MHQTNSTVFHVFQVSSTYDSLLGGKLLYVSGPCLMSNLVAEDTEFTCEFVKRNEDNPVKIATKAYRLVAEDSKGTPSPSPNFYLKCVTPRFFKIGTYTLKLVGAVDSLPQFTSEFFVGRCFQFYCIEYFTTLSFILKTNVAH